MTSAASSLTVIWDCVLISGYMSMSHISFGLSSVPSMKQQSFYTLHKNSTTNLITRFNTFKPLILNHGLMALWIKSTGLDATGNYSLSWERWERLNANTPAREIQESIVFIMNEKWHRLSLTVFAWVLHIVLLLSHNWAKASFISLHRTQFNITCD